MSITYIKYLNLIDQVLSTSPKAIFTLQKWNRSCIYMYLHYSCFM